jgi:hypothetical protein
VKKSKLLSLIFLWILSASAVAADIDFYGQLGFVQENGTGSVYYGTPLGTLFGGSIDDSTGSGHISNGSIVTTFGCCIAAGGLEVINNLSLDELEVLMLNSLLGANVYSVGDVVDIINIEGDTQTASNGRIEIGLSYVFHQNAFVNDSLNNYPFDHNDVLHSLFFIFEEDAAGDTIYVAAGLLNTVPLPAAFWLFGSGLAGLIGLRASRRKR